MMKDEMTETMTPRRPLRPEEIFDAALALRERAERAEAEVEELKKGKVFVDPKWIYNLETQLAKAHEELCRAGLREYGN